MAWKPGLAVSRQAGPWISLWSTLPSRCMPAGTGFTAPVEVTESPWHMTQPVRSDETSGCAPAGAVPWQEALAQVPVARFQPRPRFTSAGPFPRWPAASTSAGFTWQTMQSYAWARALPATCAVWAPTRSGSAELPQVALGGAPVWLALPPWHMVHFVFQVAPWHWAQGTAVFPPWRSAPWQLWQPARPRLAAAAWKAELAWSIHSGPCTFWKSTLPSRWSPTGGRISPPAVLTELGWQVLQPARSLPTAGCGAGGGTPWQAPQAVSVSAVLVQSGER